MSSRYLNNNRKAKKGISPVIATVILVAVAVVIAAALAGFSSSLFGSYSQGSQITVRSISVSAAGADGTLEIVNKGGAAEKVVKVSIAQYGEALAADGDVTVAAGDPIILANSEAVVDFVGLDDVNPQDIADAAGKTITVTVTTESGQAYTLSTVVQD